jgi:hypothetical protein
MGEIERRETIMSSGLLTTGVMNGRIHPEHFRTLGSTDRREETRVACEPVTVHVYLGEREQPVAASIVQVSSSGLRLLAEEPVLVGTPVRIDMGGLIVQGNTRHCQPRQDNRSYTVGVVTHTHMLPYT